MATDLALHEHGDIDIGKHHKPPEIALVGLYSGRSSTAFATQPVTNAVNDSD